MAFNGKVALVTGGGSGMGQRAAQILAGQGASVAILDVNEPGMEKTVQGKSNIRPYRVDISDHDAVRQAVDSIEADLGPIDRVSHAAAIMPFGKLLDQDPALQLKLMDINYGGLVNIATTTLPGMVRRGAGDFISFSSMSGIIPGLLMGGYCATKAATSMYTEILYHENINSGVRFCCVCPPPVATPLSKPAEDTIVPQMTKEAAAISPDEVLEEIERCLETGKYLCFPGRDYSHGLLHAAPLPGQLWKLSHKVEGF